MDIDMTAAEILSEMGFNVKVTKADGENYKMEVTIGDDHPILDLSNFPYAPSVYPEFTEEQWERDPYMCAFLVVFQLGRDIGRLDAHGITS